MKKKAKKVCCYIGLGLSVIIPVVVAVVAYDKGYDRGEYDGWLAGARWGIRA